jgi:hypothetical protein
MKRALRVRRCTERQPKRQKNAGNLRSADTSRPRGPGARHSEEPAKNRTPIRTSPTSSAFLLRPKSWRSHHNKKRLTCRSHKAGTFYSVSDSETQSGHFQAVTNDMPTQPSSPNRLYHISWEGSNWIIVRAVSTVTRDFSLSCAAKAIRIYCSKSVRRQVAGLLFEQLAAGFVYLGAPQINPIRHRKPKIESIYPKISTSLIVSVGVGEACPPDSGTNCVAPPP